jgi:hypothetical protein
MTSDHESQAVLEICANIKRMGYAASSRVRLYGEDFDILSDPFPEAGGIAVQVKAQKDSRIRTIQIPTTFLKNIRRSGQNAA